jgi:hypothetical protein
VIVTTREQAQLIVEVKALRAVRLRAKRSVVRLHPGSRYQNVNRMASCVSLG